MAARSPSRAASARINPPSVDLWPTEPQLMQLMLDRAEDALQELIHLNSYDGDYTDADLDIDQALAMALQHVASMRAAKLDGDDFTRQWQMLSSVLRMCNAAFSRPDHITGRGLRFAAEMFPQLDDLMQWRHLRLNPYTPPDQASQGVPA